jgi:hypothetical protein
VPTAEELLNWYERWHLLMIANLAGVCTRAAGLFLFGKGETSGKLVAERIYFDNETVMQQITGKLDASSIPNFVSRGQSVAVP